MSQPTDKPGGDFADLTDAAMALLGANGPAHFAPWTTQPIGLLGEHWALCNSKGQVLGIVYEEGNARFIATARNEVVRFAGAVRDAAYRNPESYLRDHEMAEIARRLGDDDQGRMLLHLISSLRDAMRVRGGLP